MVPLPDAEFPAPCPSPANSLGHWIKTSFALLLIAVAVAAWWPRLQPALKHRVNQPYVSALYSVRTEQGWLVNDIGHRILEVLLASGQTSPTTSVRFDGGAKFDGTEYRFSASWKGAAEVRTTIQAKNYLWSPDNFVPWAQALLRTLHPKINRSSGALHYDFITRLTNPRPEILIKEDLRISEELAKQPLDPHLHEQAALLIGSFALREASSDFADNRRELNAIAAHLAIAKTLAGDLSPYGDLAESILSSLVGRQAAALAILDRWQREAGGSNGVPSDTATIWARALKMYNTGDYRGLDQPEHASLLERLEFFRAIHSNIGSAAASGFIDRYPVEPLAEWTTRLMTGVISVEEGHHWSGRALSNELDAASAEYRSYHHKPADQTELAQALNTPWEYYSATGKDSGRRQILGWGAWAAMHQRQLCDLVQTIYYWLEYKYGDHEDAAGFRKRVSDRFGGLDLFPLISFDTKNDQQGVRPFDTAVVAVAQKHREWITYQRWEDSFNHLAKSAPNRPEQRSGSTMFAFFHPLLPKGTAYDLHNRASNQYLMGLSDTALDELKATAPYYPPVVWEDLQRKTKHQAKPDQIISAFNELSGYNVWAMEVIANAVRDDPGRYAGVYNVICRFEPDKYISLGDYLVEHGDEAGAARAYHNGFDRAPDRVYVSNSCGWLVDYYFDHGRKDDAEKIARYVGEVYSHRGLTTFASFLERSGKFGDAEDNLTKISRRYSDDGPLVAFYVRNGGRDARYSKLGREGVAKYFPNGMQRVELSGFAEKPTQGVLLSRASATSQRIGLWVGDVLVALDGYRIANTDQYYIVRDMSTSPAVMYTVWRNGKYLEVKGRIPGRQLGARVENYRSH